MTEYTLETNTVAQYLIEKGLVSPGTDVTARTLGGGVSNRVIAARTDERCFVLKQPLSNLAVEDDWPATVDRVHNEAAAMRAYTDILDDHSDLCVPAVEYEDERNHVLVMECAPENAGMWKRDLLAGCVDIDVARRVGRALGIVHGHARTDSALREQFADPTPFDQLRIDPYHRTTARRHPDLQDRIEAEIERVRSVQRTLVHGDYSPKNVLVAADRSGVWILDFEVAHWGDPAFDTAFMLNHLCIKSVYNSGTMSAYLDAARTFWDAYREQTEQDIETETVRELGILLLARVDGKSPVEYVTEETTAETLRDIARTIITDELTTVSECLTVVREKGGQLQ